MSSRGARRKRFPQRGSFIALLALLIWAALPNGSFYPGAHPNRKHFLFARDSHSFRRFHHLSCATPVKASVRLYPSSNIRNSWPGRIITFAEIVGQENVIAGTDCILGGRVHPQSARAKLRALRDGAALASKKLCVEGDDGGHVFTECRKTLIQAVQKGLQMRGA